MPHIPDDTAGRFCRNNVCIHAAIGKRIIKAVRAVKMISKPCNTAGITVCPILRSRLFCLDCTSKRAAAENRIVGRTDQTAGAAPDYNALRAAILKDCPPAVAPDERPRARSGLPIARIIAYVDKNIFQLQTDKASRHSFPEQPGIDMFIVEEGRTYRKIAYRIAVRVVNGAS